jgi:hypothetical protein
VTTQIVVEQNKLIKVLGRMAVKEHLQACTIIFFVAKQAISIIPAEVVVLKCI